MLKVLIDARKIADGGIGTYIRNLIAGIQQLPDVQLKIIVAAGMRGRYFRIEDVPQHESNCKPYSLAEQFSLGFRINSASISADVDVFHEPHYTLPLALKMPAVVTVHDIIHISDPERWYYPYIARPMIYSALKRSRKIIAVSETTKEALLKSFPGLSWLNSKITVIQNAVSMTLCEAPADWRLVLQQRFGLEPGYLFGLFSMLKPHKGFSDLVEAYRRARASKNNLPGLVVAGKGLKSAAPELLGNLHESGIITLGQVSDQELACLYKGALATVVPSLVEGFGLSALEAKVLGSPLLTRPLPSLRTVTDQRDFICENMSLTALASAIAAVDQNFPVSAENITNKDLLERFSVASVARQTVDVYREAAGQ